jgi:hypothetical protein
MIIRDILQEELENAKDRKWFFIQELCCLPKGKIIEKFINGHCYHYLLFREGKKVNLRYKGKLSEQELKDYAQKHSQRQQLKKQIQDIKKNIVFIEKCLRLSV